MTPYDWRAGASQLSRLNGKMFLFIYLVGRYVHPLRACADNRNNMAANPHAEGCGYA